MYGDVMDTWEQDAMNGTARKETEDVTKEEVYGCCILIITGISSIFLSFLVHEGCTCQLCGLQ